MLDPTSLGLCPNSRKLILFFFFFYITISNLNLVAMIEKLNNLN